MLVLREQLSTYRKTTGARAGHAARHLSLALAKVIADGLLGYYMERRGYQDPEELYDDPFYSTGVFERLQAWGKADVVQLFLEVLQYDLDSNELFCKVQAFFLGLGDMVGGSRTRGEAKYAFLPAQPSGDHLSICTAFFELLP